MSDPYVVMVTVDFAPWDSDVENDIRLFHFSGPDEAEGFRLSAIRVAEHEANEVINVSVSDKEPIVHFGDSDAALMALRDWIGEGD